jgi:hypothetical protein
MEQAAPGVGRSKSLRESGFHNRQLVFHGRSQSQLPGVGLVRVRSSVISPPILDPSSQPILFGAPATLRWGESPTVRSGESAASRFSAQPASHSGATFSGSSGGGGSPSPAFLERNPDRKRSSKSIVSRPTSTNMSRIAGPVAVSTPESGRTDSVYYQMRSAPSSSRISLTNPPPMKGVWLDEEDEDDDGFEQMRKNYIKRQSSFNVAGKPKIRTSNSGFLKMGFGGKNKSIDPLDIKTGVPLQMISSQTVSPTSNLRPIKTPIESNQTPISQAPTPAHAPGSSPKSSSHHTRSSSATKLLKFLKSSPTKPHHKKSVSKDEISAPTDFVHKGHVDAPKYHRSSYMIPYNSSLQRSMNAPPPMWNQSTISVRSNLSGEEESRPMAHIREHSTSSTFSMASSLANTHVSTITTNTTPTTTPRSEKDEQDLAPPEAKSLNKQTSLDSFGSWPTANTEFVEQHKWLLHNTVDTESFQLNKSPSASPYYASSQSTTPGTSNGPSSRRFQGARMHDSFWQGINGASPDDRERKSVLLPSPLLPASDGQLRMRTSRTDLRDVQEEEEINKETWF